MARSGRSSNCLIACGVGCLVLVAAAIALFAGGAWWLRGMMSGFQEAVEAGSSLEERFGEPSDFTPAADGSIAAERLEAFLAIREATRESRGRIAAVFEKLPLSEEEERAIEEQPFAEKMGTVFGIVSSAVGLGPDLAAFYRERNAAFGRHEMGLGEYGYIYVLAYHSWLGKSPLDGPGDDKDVREEFGDTHRRVRRTLIANLENQLATLGGPGPEAEPGGPSAALIAEIEALRRDRDRVPWEDGLPLAVESSLEPYRERLEATYDPILRPFELGRMEKTGRFTIEVD